MVSFNLEYTDTFGGEANYCWVRREKISLPDNSSDRKIMRAAKRKMRLSGMRGRVDRYGDMIEFRPYRCHTVMFITVEY